MRILPPYTGVYPGTVAAHVVADDGTSLGEILVIVPTIAQNQKLGPALPLGTVGGGGVTKSNGVTEPRGFFAVPPIGAAVGVLFLGGDPSQPFYLAGWWGTPNGKTEVPDASNDADDPGPDANSNPTGVGAPRGSPDVQVWETAKWRLIAADGTYHKFRIQSKTDPDLFFLFDATTGRITMRVSAVVRIEAKGSPDAYVEIDGATGKIVVEGTAVELGTAGATEAAVLGTAFLALFNAHGHAGVAAGGSVSGPPTTPMIPGTHTSGIVSVA